MSGHFRPSIIRAQGGHLLEQPMRDLYLLGKGGYRGRLEECSQWHRHSQRAAYSGDDLRGQ